MCGITGFWDSSTDKPADARSSVARGMADAIVHRGPDDSGVWADAATGVALAHRRLSILDLSEAGHQPMQSATGRYVIAFNGEIYNHLALRKELDCHAPAGLAMTEEVDCHASLAMTNLDRHGSSTLAMTEEVDCHGSSILAMTNLDCHAPTGLAMTNLDRHAPTGLAMTPDELRHCEEAQPTRQSSIGVWRGHSDTETLLAAFERWGVEATLQKSVGMFAIALWDREAQVLTLARDRMGEKPLYYGWQGDTFLFGSELKALKAHPSFAGEIDRQALTLFLRYNYIPAPYSIYRGIHKLPAGTFVQLQLAGDRSTVTRHTLQPVPYWSLAAVAKRGQKSPFPGSDAEALALLESTLGQAVAGQQIADVPLGAFLSGGIDSSLIVSLMQVHASQPVKTFTIGFEEGDYNEAEHAKAVAQHLGTEHTEFYVSPQDAMVVIPELPHLYDEPFADASQIPTYLVARMAKQHVTVALSGDGGDELFGGYNRHVWSRAIRNRSARLPKVLRHGAATVATTVSPAVWDHLNAMAGHLLPDRYRVVQAGEKIHKLARLFTLDDDAALYRALVSQWHDPASVVIGGSEPEALVTPAFTEIEQRMMLIDALTYLPDDVLCKVDRAAMGVSLETRVPLLDHRVVELAWQLPLNMKIRDGQGKWLLRQLLYKFVPRSLIERPKQGFALPIDQWLRGPLREWAEALLDEKRLLREGYFHPAPIRAAWREHVAGQNRQYQLWGVLMFQSWLDAQ